MVKVVLVVQVVQVIQVVQVVRVAWVVRVVLVIKFVNAYGLHGLNYRDVTLVTDTLTWESSAVSCLSRIRKSKIGRHDETWVPSHWLPYPDPCYLGGKFLFQARQSLTMKVFAVSVQIRPVDPQLYCIRNILRKSRFQSVFLFGWFFLQFSSCALSCSQVWIQGFLFSK